jgi:hypothetical protein
MRQNFPMAADEEKDFNTETLNLYRISGVAGLLLQKGENIMANHMPFSDQRATQLGELVRKMTQGYTTVQRNIKQVLLKYDSGALLIVNQADTQLALLLTARVDIDVISNAASVFMAEHAQRLMTASATKARQSNRVQDQNGPREMVVTGSKAASNGAKLLVEAPKPEISRWPEIRRELENLLGKVMGRAQVNKLVERVCIEKKIADPFQLTVVKAKELAMSVLEEIPNRSKRAALSTELKQTFEELNLNQ